MVSPQLPDAVDSVSESSTPAKKKILLVSSSGGHLKHLTATMPAWEPYERVWVSFKQPDVESALQDERTYWAYYPTTRNLKNAVRNFFLALKIFAKERPDAVVSAGAGVAVPFFVVAKLRGVKSQYIECYDRPTLPTMTGKMLYVIADEIMVQSSAAQQNFPEAQVIHPIF